MSVAAPTVNIRPRVRSTELQFWWSPPVQIWVAGGYNQYQTSSIAFSTDGMTWQASANNPFINGICVGIAWNGSYWMAIGTGENSIAKSIDGNTWIPVLNTPFSGGGFGQQVAWNSADAYWVAVGNSLDNSISIIKSFDGITWVDSSNNPFSGNSGFGIAWNGLAWVAVGSNSDYSVCIAKSTDGMTWSDSFTDGGNNPFSGGAGLAIAWSVSGSYWIAGGYNEDHTVCISKSTNGTIWTDASNNPFSGGVCYGITWNASGSYWLACGYNSDSTVCIAKSTDGMTWIPSSNNLFSICFKISWSTGDNYWVAVGNTSSGPSVCIATSTDGMTWIPSTNNPFSGGQGFGISNNLIPITGYVLESINPPVTQVVGPSSSAIITGLTNLTDYSFTIKTNSSGSYSSTVPFRTVRTSGKPGPVATLEKTQSIVGGLLTVTFNWTNPADYAYFYIYSLRIATGNKDTIYKGTRKYSTLTHTFTGLDPSRSYSFHIERGNDSGYSEVTSLTTTPVYFDPTTVAGLHFWADAADVSGNSSFVSDGTVITSWKDKSGTSNNATATTGAVLQTDSVGRYLDFTGSSWYSLAQSSWAYGEYFTFFVVDKPVDYDGSYTLISNQASSTDSLIITYNAADGIRLSTGGDNYALGNAFQSVSAPVNIWCFTNYGGKTAYWNKLISGKAATPAAFITDSLLSIGAVQGSTNLYNGRMREILMYSGIMSETNTEAITTYLYNKWFTQPNTIPQNPVENSTVLWLDAQDKTTFFQDLSGTVPVTSGGQNVRLWKDKSGFGNDIGCTGGGTPQYSTNVLNNLPSFFNNNTGGTIQTNNYLQTGDATLFLVAKATSAPTYYFIHDTLNNFGLTKISALSWHESGTENNNRFTDAGNPFIFYGKMQKGQLLSGSFIDSAGIQSSYTVDTLAMTVSTAPIKLAVTGSVYYGEVIYYNRVLTDAEIQTNATYLSNKWGIAIPADTPFSPTKISGLQLWLDASDPYTTFENDGVLTVWKDRTANGNNAIPHGSPTVNNGVVFDGSGQWLSLPDGALPRYNYSYYIVSKLVGDSAIINAGSKDISGQMWVSVGGNATIATSTDGMVWTLSTNTPFTDGNGYGIGWSDSDSYWVAIGTNSTHTVCIATSTDGMTWTDSSNNPFYVGFAIAWNGLDWVAVGYNADSTVCIAKSTDGMTWTNSTDNPFFQGAGFAIAWNSSYWVAAGYNADNTVCISKSTDGLIWTDSSNNPFYGGLAGGIAWSASGSYWVAVGYNSSYTVSIAKSYDGMTWTPSSNNPFYGYRAYGIAWNGSAWVAVATGTQCIATSTDGMTWTPSTNNPFAGGNANGIAWSASASMWVAVGYNVGNSVCIATSTDGLIWTPSLNNPYSGVEALGIASGVAPIHNSLTTITATTVPETTTYLAKTTFDNMSAVSPLEDTNIIPNNTTVIIESIYNFSGTAKTLFLSGLTGETDTSIHIQDASNNFIGKDLSGGYMNGTINEILVYNTAHTTEQRQQIELYLKNKWYPATYTPTGASLWLDSASTLNFTLSGSSVQVWKDKSAQATNYSQSYKWAQPLYSLDSVTGRHGVQFGADAIATGLTNSTSPFGNTSSWSVFAVQRFDYSTTDASEKVSGNVCTTYKAAPSSLVPGWVAVGNAGYNPVYIATSTDGIIWNPSINTPFSGGVGLGVAWNGSYWIAVGSGAYTIWKSTDGMTWIHSINNPFSGGQALGIKWAATGSYWVAVGFNDTQLVTIARSTDGLNWTPSENNPLSGVPNGIEWNGSVWIAAGGTGNNIATSSNAITWTSSSNNHFTGGINGVVWNSTHSYWLIFGSSNNQSVSIAKSTDGITWTDASNNPFTDESSFGVSGCYDIAWNTSGGYWVAVGKSPSGINNIAKSSDGMTWTVSINNPFSGAIANGISWNGSVWVAVGYDGSDSVSVASSTDGMNWIDSVSSGGNNPFHGSAGIKISYGNITLPSVLSIGTEYVSTPSEGELKFSIYNQSIVSNVEIHKRPVLTGQIVNSLVYNSFYNGVSNEEDYNIIQGMTTGIKLNIGYTENLTPALAGAMRGYIYELIVFKTAITTETRQAVEGYLAWKWGIQDLLASTHPYYLAPPN